MIFIDWGAVSYRALNQIRFFCLPHDHNGIHYLENKKRDKYKDSLTALDVDDVPGAYSLGDADAKMESADPDVAVTQLVEKLIQVGSMGGKNIFVSQQPADFFNGQSIIMSEQQGLNVLS